MTVVVKKRKPSITGEGQFVNLTRDVEMFHAFSVRLRDDHGRSLHERALADKPPVAPGRMTLHGRALADKPPVAPGGMTMAEVYMEEHWRTSRQWRPALYNTPFVDGVPVTRGSRATAARSARARALKTASAMW